MAGSAHKGAQGDVGPVTGLKICSDLSRDASARGSTSVWSMRAIGHVQSVFMQRWEIILISTLSSLPVLHAIV
jgi:hypothetical protein